MILVSVVSGLSEVNSTFLSGNGVKDLGDGVADGIAGHEDLSMLCMSPTRNFADQLKKLKGLRSGLKGNCSLQAGERYPIHSHPAYLGDLYPKPSHEHFLF